MSPPTKADFNPVDHPRGPDGQFIDAPDVDLSAAVEFADTLIEHDGLFYEQAEDVGREGVAWVPEELPDIRRSLSGLRSDLRAAERGEDIGDDPQEVREQIASAEWEIRVLERLAQRLEGKMTSTVTRKRLGRVELKDAARGEISAVFATFNVVDADGDVTVPGAFAGNGEVPISAYGHSSWGTGVPIGKGTIRETPTEAILDGRLFMDTQAGRDTFTTLKELGELGQWSYGYDTLLGEPGVMDGREVQFLKQQRVYEVSPVLRGAGVGTRTLSAKSRKETPVEVLYKAAIRPHSSAVTNREWDGPAVVAAIPDGASVSDLRSVYAWVDSGGDPEAKSSYKFPHHHGVDGPANVRALIAGIAALNGARGGSSIPEADRQAVYNHLAGHLRSADREPPELRSLDGGALKLHEEAFEVLGGIADYLDSAKRVVALRAQKGKSLSQVNLEALAWVGEDLQRLVAEHKALVRRLEDKPREAVAEEFVRYLATQRRAEV